MVDPWRVLDLSTPRHVTQIQVEGRTPETVHGFGSLPNEAIPAVIEQAHGILPVRDRAGRQPIALAENLGSPKPVSCLPSQGRRQSGWRVSRVAGV